MDKTAYEAIKRVNKPVRKKEPKPWGDRLTYLIGEVLEELKPKG